MKKLTTIALAVLFCASAARAESTRPSTTVTAKDQQPKILVGADVDFALPIGNYSNVNGVGGTLMLKGEYPVLPEVGATLRVGFQFHSDKDVSAGASAHVHSIPVLLGAQYYFMPDHQGVFAAGEVGLFYLLTGATVGGVSGSSSDAKFGMGAGVGYQMKQWNVRVNLHSQDIGSFGDSLMLSGGVGYQFAGL
jgi:hypothetical protein